MTNDDRDALAADLKVGEGLRLKSYQDTVGVWTIGYGTNLQELEIPLSLAEQWLRDEMTAAEQDAQTFPWFGELNGVRQRAICELIYNLGLTRFSKFVRTIEALAGEDYDTAAKQLQASKWATQVGPTRSGRIITMVRTGVA